MFLQIFLFFLLFLLDQLVKNFVLVVSFSGTKKICLIRNFLDINYTENRGIAFGIFNRLNKFIIIVLVVLVLLTLAFYIFKNYKLLKNKAVRLFLTFVISGGVSNLLDRLIRGYVLDYIDLKFFQPIFNLADIYITVGIVMLAFRIFSNLKEH